MRLTSTRPLLFAAALGLAGELAAQQPATRAAYIDRAGVMRWKDDRSEVALFGANYVIHTASDYRAAGHAGGDRKAMIDEDMAQFARMGWDGLRLTFWGDWESSDSLGNLLATDHLDLLDWLIARARARGIYMLFSPIQLYNAKWPDALADTTAPGFGRRYPRERMGTDPAAIAAQVTYLRQILNHVNPYTGVALKDEPAILFLELVNEPVHHPDDLEGSVRYINTLTDAVRSTGCRTPIFYNVSQDFRIGEAIRRSKAQGITFGWYPSALNAGYELPGNFLRAVDDFPDMRRPELARLPRIVYEFDSPDLRTGTMYPAMARAFRAVGAQFAAMFAYDMQRTASRNLGWQTHYLSLAYTPRKAMSAIVAAEAMKRLPRGRDYGPYPGNARFGDFRVSAEENLGELVSTDAFLYAGTTRSTPPDPAALRRIAGYGSSPTVTYGGEGIYFLDRVRAGLWRLEVYPDAVPVRDPFELPRPDKVVTRAIRRPWPMTVHLPDLGPAFSVQSVLAGSPAPARAAEGRFIVTPGVYLLSASGPVDAATLPSHVGQVGMTEYHPPPEDTLPTVVTPLAPAALLAGREAELRARVVDPTPPDSARLFLRRTAGDWYHAYPMRPAGGYEYAASIPGAELRAGPYEYVITLYRAGAATTFPGHRAAQPWDWNFGAEGSWPLPVVDPGTPLTLFDPATDLGRLAFTRIGDAGRSGRFQVGLSPLTGGTVFHLPLPVDRSGWSPEDYTASLVIADRVSARGETIAAATRLRLRARGLGAGQRLHLTLMEDDGTSWSAAVPLDSAWAELEVPLASLTVARGVLLPQGFPGEWNYWVGPAAGRGGTGDRPRLERLERLQLSVRRADGMAAVPDAYGVEVEWVRLEFGDGP
ncbi:MAG TPA: hypothetical protein PKA50_01215 [Gemmatimonadales bacterium]|nr:hypothetical protein [Gemmatimonadales bacterium]